MLDAYMVFVSQSPFPIEGETSDVVGVEAKAFEIIDFKWGASSIEKEKPVRGAGNANSMDELSSGSMSGRTIEVGTFSISKPIDTASLALFRACTTEDCKFDKAKVLFRKMASDAEPYVFMSFEFSKVQIDKIEWKIASVDSTDKPAEEDLEFSFNNCKIYYIPQGKAADKKKEIKQTAEYERPEGTNAVVQEDS